MKELARERLVRLARVPAVEAILISMMCDEVFVLKMLPRLVAGLLLPVSTVLLVYISRV